jgi:hypothetical protein
VSYVEKTKFNAKRSSSPYISLSFLHGTQKKTILRENWRARIEYQYVHMEFLFRFFIYYKCFSMVGAYAHCIKSAFPEKNAILNTHVDTYSSKVETKGFLN